MARWTQQGWPFGRSIGVNYDVYQPGYQQILERYLKFSKGGADISLLDEGGDGDDGEGEYYI